MSIPVLPQRRLGGRTVSSLGLGAMPLSDERMLAHREQALGVVHLALDLGVTLLDTANIYAPSWDTVGHNEALVGEALRSWSGPAEHLAGVVVATKGGLVRGPGESWGNDGSPDGLRRAAEASAAALDWPIGLYLLHRPDPAVRWRDQLVGLRALAHDGVVERIGLSNVTPAQLAVALEVVGGPDEGGVTAVQNEFSPRFREYPELVDVCAARGIAYEPWSPLGGQQGLAGDDPRLEPFRTVAAARGTSPQRVALAWLLARSSAVIPIPGATRSETLLDSVAAVRLVLTADERAALDATEADGVSVFPDDTPGPPID